MRVLAVGGAAFTEAITRLALHEWGYDVIVVDHVDDALAKVIGDSIQIVIVDCDVLGAVALCRKIRVSNLSFYPYIISAVSPDDTQYAMAGQDLGVDDFIYKPVQLGDLQRRIRVSEKVLYLQKTLSEANARVSALAEQLLTAQKIINSDLQMAGEIQRGLLPSNSSNLQGVSIDWLFRPSTHVSGDVFNFFRLDEQHIGFYIIDVAGHGIPAAMQSFTLSRLLMPDLDRADTFKCRLQEPPCYQNVRPSDAVVTDLNGQFQTDITHTLYFTMVYGVIDTHSQLIDLCQAGHPHPIYQPQGSPPLFVGENCLPVGILTLAQYRSTQLNYQTGDRLFFYSDGIIDCASPDEELFGSKRLLEFIDATRQLSSDEVLRQLDEQIRLWHGSDAFEDDISMLVLEMVPPVGQVLSNSTMQERVLGY